MVPSAWNRQVLAASADRRKETEMSVEMKSTLRGAILACFAVVLLLASQGCKKEQSTAQQSSGEQAMAQAKETEQAATSEVATAVAVEQTTCPIMEGNPIDKAIFVEYKGKKVYFCCEGCPERFQADPAQYIAKLPQFKE
jgi:YHS domain-containing protein